VLSGELVRCAARSDKLNENQRRVIELAYFEGLSQTEMRSKWASRWGL